MGVTEWLLAGGGSLALVGFITWRVFANLLQEREQATVDRLAREEAERQQKRKAHEAEIYAAPARDKPAVADAYRKLRDEYRH